MPNYRRSHISGGTFFFTVVTHRRRKLFEDATSRTLLGEMIRECQRDWPFEVDAMVLLPDHLHTIWTLLANDEDYSGRWSVIKKTFTTGFLDRGGADMKVSEGKQRERRRGIWQRRFWEHTIEDEDDFENHFNYIHYNPVKHKLVQCPVDWESSSFHRWVREGVYSADWGCGLRDAPVFSECIDDYGEPK